MPQTQTKADDRQKAKKMWNDDIQVKCVNTVREEYERGDYDNLPLEKVTEKIVSAISDIKTQQQGFDVDEYLAEILPALFDKALGKVYEN